MSIVAELLKLVVRIGFVFIQMIIEALILLFGLGAALLRRALAE